MVITKTPQLSSIVVCKIQQCHKYECVPINFTHLSSWFTVNKWHKFGRLPSAKSDFCYLAIFIWNDILLASLNDFDTGICQDQHVQRNDLLIYGLLSYRQLLYKHFSSVKCACTISKGWKYDS